MSASRPIDPDAKGRWEALPGSEIVLPGIEDLGAGRLTINAMAVQCAATRLSKLGMKAPRAEDGEPAAHRLYEELSEKLGSGAHSRYNAILRRVASFAAAAGRAQRG